MGIFLSATFLLVVAYAKKQFDNLRDSVFLRRITRLVFDYGSSFFVFDSGFCFYSFLIDQSACAPDAARRLSNYNRLICRSNGGNCCYSW